MEDRRLNQMEAEMASAQEEVEAAQAEVEAVAETAETTLESLRADLEAMIDQRFNAMVDEAVRLSGMTDAERAEYEADRREEALNARLHDIERREMRADVLETLAKRGLPPELADAVGYESREALEATVDAIERAFREAVKQAVEERLKGTSPAAGASSQSDDLMDDETYYRMNYAYR